MSDELARVAIFQQKEVRKQLHGGEWWFSVVDVVAALTDSADAGAYWRKLKQRLIAEGSNQTVTSCHGLKFTAQDSKPVVSKQNHLPGNQKKELR